ncbi:Uncharacterised protein [Actinobaculum suis]|uniref:Helix-turn-helix domain-containing protein n=1 Tax=Actinobaculum suis TaxID=1657 RepID=A0A7Z8Y867_9ACTO|nr:helix-turn-helix domain-containing protein [Actinobaculum suis]VDG75697.1 Uncharacterised protein [Actinobaculum suis]
MSWRASAWALDQVRGIGANCKLVLLSLCEFANDEQVTWRSMGEIAHRSECEVRTVKTHLKSLEEWGLITRTPRYRWCDSDAPSCASRGAHKHRSGTDYRVNMEVGDFDASKQEAPAGKPEPAENRPVDNSPVDNSPVENLPVDKSTSAKFAPVEEVAESRGKVHKCKSFTCEEGEGSTGANSRLPQVQKHVPIRSVNPHVDPPASHTLTGSNETGRVGSRSGLVAGGRESVQGGTGDVVAGAADAGPGEPGLSGPGRGGPGLRVVADPAQDTSPAPVSDSAAGVGVDLGLVDACVPSRLREVLLPSALGRVCDLLREALRLGWKPIQIHTRLNMDPFPQDAKNPAGLVIFRVGQFTSEVPATARKARSHTNSLVDTSVPAGERASAPPAGWAELGEKLRANAALAHRERGW